MSESGKIATQEGLRAAFKAREVVFAPLEISLVDGHEGVVEVAWRGYRGRFVYAYKPQIGPKAIREAASIAQQMSSAAVLPLAVVPFLSEEGLTVLEELGVSGLDLCGNGVLIDPPRLMVRRTGASSRFKRSELARNVYQGISSLVARVLLAHRGFASLREVWIECQRSLCNESLLQPGTISKALKQMEEDLFIARSGSRGEIRLIRPAELLERLHRDYLAPQVTRSMSGKIVGAVPGWERVREVADARQIRWVATGRGSAMFHTAMSGPSKLQLYVTDLSPFDRHEVLAPTMAFPNVELFETADERVYFDAREHDGKRWASAVQTYLELADAGPRERETAEDLRGKILRALER